MLASLPTLLRSGPVLVGLLLVSVGVADIVNGRTKLAQYEEILRVAPDQPARDPAALFPTASEEEERLAVARTKIGYYQLMLTAGRFLMVVGVLLLLVGVMRARQRMLQARLSH